MKRRQIIEALGAASVVPWLSACGGGGGGATSAAAAPAAAPAPAPAASAAPTPSAPATRTTELRVVTFGDSTAALAWPTVPDVQAFETVTGELGNPEGRFIGINNVAVWCTPIWYPLARLVGCCGVPGATTAQMLGRSNEPASATRRAVEDAVAQKPDVVIFRGGSINNLLDATEATVQARISASLADHRALLTKFVAAQVRVLDCGIFGYDNETPGSPFEALVRNALKQINAGLEALCSEPAFKDWVRYVSPVGRVQTDAGGFVPGYTNDGVHLNCPGGLAHGRHEAEILESWFGASQGNLYTPDTAHPNILRNASFAIVETKAAGYGQGPVGYEFGTTGGTLGKGKVETVGGASFFTVQADMPAGASSISAYLPLGPTLSGLAEGTILGIEFDFFVEGLQGYSLVPAQSFAATAEFSNGAPGTLSHSAFLAPAFSGNATLTGVTGRAVFLPFRLPVAGDALSAASTLSLTIDFQNPTAGTLKAGIGSPRIVTRAA